jgi:hypothetical protein
VAQHWPESLQTAAADGQQRSLPALPSLSLPQVCPLGQQKFESWHARSADAQQKSSPAFPLASSKQV